MTTKRDHLRALLDRARNARTRVKCEPTADATPSLPPPPSSQGGLLPTPGATPAAAVATPPPHLSRHHAQHAHAAALDDGAFAAACYSSVSPPMATAYYAPPCACPQFTSVAHQPAHQPAHDQWHHTHPPPTVLIPPTYPTVDLDAIDQALTAHAASISPSMSATTSSSSSSNAKRKRRQLSPSPERTEPPAEVQQSVGRKAATPMISPAAVASLEEYADHELHSDFVHTVHMLIPASAFGCLIGHRGEFMKETNAVSGCTLSVRDQNSFPTFDADRVLRIYGKSKGICLAQRIVIERIRNFHAHKGDSSYINLGSLPLVPMGEKFVTSTISEVIGADGYEDEEDVAARQGKLRWLIDTDNVGKIMGQQGMILKAITRDTDTSIHVVPIQSMPPGSRERTVVISGQPSNTKKARAVIESKAGGRLETDGPSSTKTGRYFVIPQHVAGFLIGPQGSRIRTIRDEYGATIQIPAQHDLPLGYVNRTLHIQGTLDQMDSARAEIERRVRTYLQSPEAAAAAAEDDIVLQLVLPIRICNFLLDQRGRLIREISEKAGAHARFLPPLDDDHRICVIYGDMPQVFRAERLVLQFIAGDAIANKWANAGGAPPRKRQRAPKTMDKSDEDTCNAYRSADVDGDMVSFGLASGSRPRKRQQVESSGRIVVHYSDLKVPKPSNRRRAPNARKKLPAKSAPSRNKRRR